MESRAGSSASECKLRIVLASGDRELLARIRDSFSNDKDIQLVGVAGDGIEAAQLTVVAQPDVVVVDDRLDGDGLRVSAVLNQVAPKAKCLLLVEGLNEKTILDAARAGAREVLGYSFEPSQFLDAVGRLSEPEKDLMGRQYEWATNPQSFPRLLLVSSGKGGTGVTSVAVNIAAALSLTKSGKTVLLDGGPRFRDSAVMLGVTPRYGLADLAQTLEESDWIYQDQILLQQSTSAAPSLDVIVSASSNLSVSALSPEWLARSALMLKRSYRYVVLDIPSSMILEVERSLPTYWRLFMVMDLQDATLLQNTRRILESLASVQSKSETVGVILNRHLKPSEFSPKDVQEVLHVPIAATIPDDHNLVRACNLGRAAVIDSPGSPASRAFLQFSRNLVTAADQPSVPGRAMAA